MVVKHRVTSGEHHENEERARKAVARAPEVAEIRYHLAVALWRAGDKAEARKEIERLLATGKKFPQADQARALLNQL